MAPWRDAIEAWLPAEGAGRSPVLDLGAGTGQFAAAIAGWFGVEVVAVEPSGGVRAQGVRAFAHPDVHWVAGRGERLPVGDGACGWAWVSTVIHHLDDLDAAAAELHRVLRPGGPVLTPLLAPTLSTVTTSVHGLVTCRARWRGPMLVLPPRSRER